MVVNRVAEAFVALNTHDGVYFPSWATKIELYAAASKNGDVACVYDTW